MGTNARIKLIFVSFTIINFVSCQNENNEQEMHSDSWPEPDPQYSGLSNEECVERIHRKCNYPTTFTDEELENVREFLNYSFTVLADIKPNKPLCHKLHVRHDWKCLTQQQRTKIIYVWQQMYEMGVIQSLTDLHVKTWPAWHKTSEFIPTHRWFLNEFEKAMRSIDPATFLPYWEATSYGCQPERASLWDVLGHSGNYSNGYAVPDGIYADWNLVPKIKRHWSPRCTIYPWDTPEYESMFIQTVKSWSQLRDKSVNDHFLVHLNAGGYEGQYSVTSAPYDVLFYLHHASRLDNVFFRWQLMDSKFLTPLDYSKTSRYNPINGNLEKANIETDFLTGVRGVTIRENFMIGFGDLCYIPDQLVKPINNLWKGKSDPIPTVAKRLPQWILHKYFPYFVSGNFTAIAHVLEEVGECNTQCLPLPKPTFLEETENGRRQLQAFRYDNGQDMGYQFTASERILYNFWLDLNRSGYCSPYVTTY